MTCADPEIFMRGGPTKMVIFGHRRGGTTPQKIPKLLFLGKIFKFQGGGGGPDNRPPHSGSAHMSLCVRKANNLCFRPGQTRTGMFSLRSRSLRFKKITCTIRVANTKALISFAVTDLRLCVRLCKLLVF